MRKECKFSSIDSTNQVEHIRLDSLQSNYQCYCAIYIVQIAVKHSNKKIR